RPPAGLGHPKPIRVGRLSYASAPRRAKRPMRHDPHLGNEERPTDRYQAESVVGLATCQPCQRTSLRPVWMVERAPADDANAMSQAQIPRRAFRRRRAAVTLAQMMAAHSGFAGSGTAATDAECRWPAELPATISFGR